jgi:hypothetical protein
MRERGRQMKTAIASTTTTTRMITSRTPMVEQYCADDVHSADRALDRVVP